MFQPALPGIGWLHIQVSHGRNQSGREIDALREKLGGVPGLAFPMAIPSGHRTESSTKGPCSIAMLDYHNLNSNGFGRIHFQPGYVAVHIGS